MTHGILFLSHALLLNGIFVVLDFALHWYAIFFLNRVCDLKIHFHWYQYIEFLTLNIPIFGTEFLLYSYLFDNDTRYSCSRPFCCCLRFPRKVAHVLFEKWWLSCCLLDVDTRYFFSNRISDLKLDFVLRWYTVFLILHVQVLRTEVLL